MKTRISALLVSLPILFAITPAPAATPAPTKADIGRLVTEAAGYEPGQSREAFQHLEAMVGTPSSSVRKYLEAGLVQLLGPGSTFEARRFACKQLGIIGSKRALPELAKLLPNEETAGIACLALTTYPPGKADEILRTAFPAAKGSSRIQIIDTLGDRRDSKAVKLLIPLAKDADAAVAGAAVAALGKIGDRAAWEFLLPFSKTAEASFQLVATEAALRCAEARAASGDTKAAIAFYQDTLGGSQPTYVRRAALDALLRLDKSQAERRILEVLHGSDDALKPVAIANVPSVASAKASEVFGAELPQLKPQEQVWMIASLAARGDTPASAAIGNCLSSPDAAVRAAAIKALGRIGGAWCVPLFARAVDRSKNADEHRALESALIELPGAKQTDLAIAAALKRTSGNARACLITALARREGQAANLLLLAEARGSDMAAARAALRALARTATAREVSPLLERLTSTRDPQVRAEAGNAVSQALPRIENPGRRSALVRDALGWAQGPESRVVLLGLLPVCGDEPALISLKAAALNPDTFIRDAAVRAMADWPNLAAWDALAQLYKQPASETVRAIALRGLVRLASEENAHPSARLVAHYRVLLDGARSDADLRLVLGALSGAVQPDALQLALPYLARAEVRPEAEAAVRKIAEAVRAQHPKIAEEALKQVQAKQ